MQVYCSVYYICAVGGVGQLSSYTLLPLQRPIKYQFIFQKDLYFDRDVWLRRLPPGPAGPVAGPQGHRASLCHRAGAGFKGEMLGTVDDCFLPQVFLLAVRYLSLLSVVGNLSLALLTATMAFRIYKSVLAAVNKSGEGNPFRVMPGKGENGFTLIF